MVISGQTSVWGDGLDPLTWLDRNSLSGELAGQTVKSVGAAITAAVQVRQEAYERQMGIDFAKKALGQCHHCSNEAELKARVDRLIKHDDSLNDAIDDAAFRAGQSGNSGLAAALHILMDPTGQRARRFKRTVNFENLISDFCYVASQKDQDARLYCINSFSMEYVMNQATEAADSCRGALRTKFGINNVTYTGPRRADDPPDAARDFFFSCLESNTVAYAMMQKVAAVCGLRYEDIKVEAPDSVKLIKTCNPDPGGPPGPPDEIVKSALKILAAHEKDSAEQAYALFSHMAAKHDPPAMYHAGQALLTGIGVQKDEAAAFNLFTQAAVRGNHDAAVALGLMYKNGIAVPQDTKSAIHWLEWVANQRIHGASGEAGITLARMYSTGDGVPVDERRALDMYQIAFIEQVGHSEYSWEAADWLIHHNYSYIALKIYEETNIPKFQFEAVKMYMKGYIYNKTKSEPPNLKRAANMLRFLMSTNKDPEVKRQAQAMYDSIPASAR
jgi:hypothetical protein